MYYLPDTLIRLILGVSHGDIRPLACSVQLVAELLFRDKVHIDEIHMGKCVYSAAAKQLGKSTHAIAKAVERLCLQCWTSGDRELMQKIAGWTVLVPCTPRETILYLAFYAQHGASMRDALMKP